MPNVLSLVPYRFLPARTGGQKAIALFYKYFSREENVTCAGVTENTPDNAGGYTLIPVMVSRPLRYVNPLLFFRLRRLIRKTKADFLLIEHPYFGWLGWMLKRFTPVKFVLRSHNIEGNRWKSLGKWWWPILWRYERFSHRRADYNIFIQDQERLYAIEHFGLKTERCHTMTFGTERTAAPSFAEKAAARAAIDTLYTLDPGKPVLIFNGAFQYGPNRQALEQVLFRINPLLQQAGLSYQLLICGMDIPVEIAAGAYQDVKIVGFVEDLAILLTASDLMLNPVTQGGGIKTKLVEALAFGQNAVSSESGAIGVDPGICGGKLTVVADEDWDGFASAIAKKLSEQRETPQVFFDCFSWPRLAAAAAAFIEGRHS